MDPAPDRSVWPVVMASLTLAGRWRRHADTFSTGVELVLDARAAGVGVAVIAAWRRAPLIVVIVLGAAVTAVVRRFA